MTIPRLHNHWIGKEVRFGTLRDDGPCSKKHRVIWNVGRQFTYEKNFGGGGASSGGMHVSQATLGHNLRCSFCAATVLSHAQYTHAFRRTRCRWRRLDPSTERTVCGNCSQGATTPLFWGAARPPIIQLVKLAQHVHAAHFVWVLWLATLADAQGARAPEAAAGELLGCCSHSLQSTNLRRLNPAPTPEAYDHTSRTHA